MQYFWSQVDLSDQSRINLKFLEIKTIKFDTLFNMIKSLFVKEHLHIDYKIKRHLKIQVSASFECIHCSLCQYIKASYHHRKKKTQSQNKIR